MRRSFLLLALVMAVALATSAPGLASPRQDSVMQDDPHLVYGTPQVVDHTLDVMKQLGVDRIRVSVFWSLVAPDPQSRTRPTFNAADPSDYPPGSWDRYDTLVRAAAARGIGVDLDVTSPVPLWAAGATENPKRFTTYEPAAGEFRQFVQAVGTRYSGSYTPSGQSGPLPRVTHWEIWNEPNQVAWLSPQYINGVAFSPRLYRELLDGAWSGLADSGHGTDTILIGVTAPNGSPKRAAGSPMAPLRFIRNLYCVNRRLHPLHGHRASNVGCPTTAAGRRRFASAHPGLFHATGYAHHPYSFIHKPNYRPPQHDDVVLGDLPRLTRTLNHILRRYRARRHLALYLTEYGYQTKPPDPTQFITPRQQAKFSNEAEYLTARNKHVRALTHFLLYDDAPNTSLPKGSRYYWSTFQTGLAFHNGRKKPAFDAYATPIWIGRHRHRHRFRVWGMLRAAPPGPVQTAHIQYRRARHGRFRTIRKVRVRSPKGYFSTAVRIRGHGQIRIAWRVAHGGTHILRSRRVSVGPR